MSGPRLPHPAHRLGHRLGHRLRLAAAWAADYAYVARWQVQGFVCREDPSGYLQPAQGTALREPVVLIPGVYEDWQLLRPLAAALAAEGHPVHTVKTLGYNRGRIDEMARRVESYLVSAGLEDAAIVAHSKGGLIGKQVLLGAEGNRIRRMVAVNTPFSGSPYARYFLIPSIRAFSPRNALLRSLQASLEANTRITSVYAAFDPHIPGGSGLDGARNIQLESMGHFRPLGDPELHRLVVRELQEGKP
ncbi:alpha/beta hydrolase [Arthrobacter koreensis]|uniref:esterase/lipase family protein n=1 Tax=Arthrobacter koreensis TaxID=199136 RepID=UPI002DBBA735|nr:alpha/beta hydrolase [Arthrobacter koreensis]MEB7503722.1 alpha/beta hydrolase [Arthrobacter koreensis]